MESVQQSPLGSSLWSKLIDGQTLTPEPIRFVKLSLSGGGAAESFGSGAAGRALAPRQYIIHTSTAPSIQQHQQQQQQQRVRSLWNKLRIDQPSNQQGHDVMAQHEQGVITAESQEGTARQGEEVSVQQPDEVEVFFNLIRAEQLIEECAVYLPDLKQEGAQEELGEAGEEGGEAAEGRKRRGVIGDALARKRRRRRAGVRDPSAPPPTSPTHTSRATPAQQHLGPPRRILPRPPRVYLYGFGAPPAVSTPQLSADGAGGPGEGGVRLGRGGRPLAPRRPKKPPRMRGFACDLCSHAYAVRKTLNRHKKAVHGVLTAPPRQKINCAIPGCPHRCYTFVQLTRHLEQEHGEVLPVQELALSSDAEFEAWLARVEHDEPCNFLKKNTAGAGRERAYYYCNRSGVFKYPALRGPDGSERERKRQMKAQGSCKIGRFCPANIITTRLPDGSVHVKYAPRHFCHSDAGEQLQHTRISKSDRRWVAAQLAAKVPFDAVIKVARGDAATGAGGAEGEGVRLRRVHLLTKKDLYNIQHQCAMNRVDCGGPGGGVGGEEEERGEDGGAGGNNDAVSAEIADIQELIEVQQQQQQGGVCAVEVLEGGVGVEGGVEGGRELARRLLADVARLVEQIEDEGEMATVVECLEVVRPTIEAMHACRSMAFPLRLTHAELGTEQGN